MEYLLTLLALVVALAVWVVSQYNSLQAAMQAIREASSNLQASMRKRVDLANQVIDIASGYGEHEKLTHVTLSNNIEGAMERVSALAQNYPQLRANETYQTLMEQLERLEQTIFERREFYNEQVKGYNVKRNSFPTVLIANKLNFDTVPYFDSEDPEALNNIKLFARDDSEALRLALNKGSDAVVRSVATAKTKLASKLEDKRDTSSTPSNPE
ncbi:LemA family protein [Pseudomonas sp.]|uniref:LemA family protein n=1 Tax=Pseudomonas sp. TaxID=306 RepID=UPI00289A811A|nr:LemA family protein [Pseudomonas sp.]